MRQYIKSKPIKWGFRFWFRCGSKFGYLYEFDMYTGKKQEAEKGMGEQVVLKLMESLKNTFCQVYFDNIFSSPNLLKQLCNGIYATGTVRQQRKNMPDKLKLKSDKEMIRGDNDWVASNVIVVVKWMDTRSVQLISNFCKS